MTTSITGLCETNTPPEKRTYGKIGFRSAKSKAAEHFLPLESRVKARAKGMFFSQTPAGPYPAVGRLSCGYPFV